MNKEEILIKNILNDLEAKDQKYTLVINKKAPNKELMLLKEESLVGAKKYYPEKEFEVLKDNSTLKEVLQEIKKLNLIDYDVIFIDKIDFESFYTTEKYLNIYTGVRSIVIDSSLRNEENKKTKKIVDIIKEQLDNSTDNYILTPFNELLLGKNISEIEEYAKEKNISLKRA